MTVEIGNIHMARGREGVEFIATRRGEIYEVVISREALDDLIQGNTEGDEAHMREAFKAHEDRIAAVADKAIAFGYGKPPNKILLQTKDF